MNHEPICAPVETETAVELMEVSGDWYVRVVERGHETVGTFPRESFAIVYAEGQRIRLGLERFIRL